MLHVLIPAAGLGRRMKSYGPKALINLQGETLIERQIRLVREAFPRVKITVVAGFEAHRLREVLPKDVRLVLNPYYETTNVAYSVSIGLRTIPPTVPVLVVYGDLV
jgi:choline kinase